MAKVTASGLFWRRRAAGDLSLVLWLRLRCRSSQCNAPAKAASANSVAGRLQVGFAGLALPDIGGEADLVAAARQVTSIAEIRELVRAKQYVAGACLQGRKAEAVVKVGFRGVLIVITVYLA